MHILPSKQIYIIQSSMPITPSSPYVRLFLRDPSLFSLSDPSRFLFSPDRVRVFGRPGSKLVLEPLAVWFGASTSITISSEPPEEVPPEVRLDLSLLRVDGREDAFPFPLGFDAVSLESCFTLGGCAYKRVQFRAVSSCF